MVTYGMLVVAYQPQLPTPPTLPLHRHLRFLYFVLGMAYLNYVCESQKILFGAPHPSVQVSRDKSAWQQPLNFATFSPRGRQNQSSFQPPRMLISGNMNPARVAGLGSDWRFWPLQQMLMPKSGLSPKLQRQIVLQGQDKLVRCE